MCSACRRPRHACRGGWAGKQFLPRGSNGWGRGVERSLLQTLAPGPTACWEEGGGELAESPLSLGGHKHCQREKMGEEEEGEGVAPEG